MLALGRLYCTFTAGRLQYTCTIGAHMCTMGTMGVYFGVHVYYGRTTYAGRTEYTYTSVYYGRTTYAGHTERFRVHFREQHPKLPLSYLYLYLYALTSEGVGSLEILDLSRNLLSGGIPASLGELLLLTSLVLAENRLSGSLPDFSKCSVLLLLVVILILLLVL
jgi:hypothetical protein